MIIVVASIIAILSVPLTGRSLAPLATLPVRRVGLVWLAIGLQLIITMIPGVPNSLGQPLHLFTFVLSAAFIWSNRHLPGVLFIAFGAALNLAAIAANGGTMPASAWAWRTAGFATLTGGFENSNVIHSRPAAVARRHSGNPQRLAPVERVQRRRRDHRRCNRLLRPHVVPSSGSRSHRRIGQRGGACSLRVNLGRVQASESRMSRRR